LLSDSLILFFSDLSVLLRRFFLEIGTDPAGRIQMHALWRLDDGFKSDTIIGGTQALEWATMTSFSSDNGDAQLQVESESSIP
jgi:hypothetical protein